MGSTKPCCKCHGTHDGPTGRRCPLTTLTEAEELTHEDTTQASTFIDSELIISPSRAMSTAEQVTGSSEVNASANATSNIQTVDKDTLLLLELKNISRRFGMFEEQAAQDRRVLAGIVSQLNTGNSENQNNAKSMLRNDQPNAVITQGRQTVTSGGVSGNTSLFDPISDVSNATRSTSRHTVSTPLTATASASHSSVYCDTRLNTNVSSSRTQNYRDTSITQQQPHLSISASSHLLPTQLPLPHSSQPHSITEIRSNRPLDTTRGTCNISSLLQERNRDCVYSTEHLQQHQEFPTQNMFANTVLADTTDPTLFSATQDSQHRGEIRTARTRHPTVEVTNTRGLHGATLQQPATQMQGAPTEPLQDSIIPSLQALKNTTEAHQRVQQRYDELERAVNHIPQGNLDFLIETIQNKVKKQEKLKIKWPQDLAFVGSLRKRPTYDQLTMGQWMLGFMRIRQEEQDPIIRDNMCDYLTELLQDSCDFSWESAKGAHSVLMHRMADGVVNWDHIDEIHKIRRRYAQTTSASLGGKRETNI